MDAIESDSEWLEADGLGGFAMGTAGLVRTRRYHALLCAATTPPTGRFVLVAGYDAVLHVGRHELPLSAQRYLPDVVHPRGDRSIVSFTAEPWPAWEFALSADQLPADQLPAELPGGLRVRHELFVPHGSSAVVLAWRLDGTVPDGVPVWLEVRPFVACRDHHQLRRERDGLPLAQRQEPDGVRWLLGDAGPDVVACGNGSYREEPIWYRDFLYREEQARGFDAVEDLLAPGVFRFDLRRTEAVLAFAAGGLPAALAGGAAAVPALRERERARRAAFPSPLHRAADAYVVARGRGRTLIAGYPWFTDWGRDTFLALRGLCHASGQRAVARDILCEWARHVSDGMLPNRFPDGGEVEYHTVDAALWFVVAAHEHLLGGAVTPDDAGLLRRAMLAIVAGYAAGTRHGIAMDDDGLLRAGERGRQLTWMDAIVDGRVVTARIGKPVEVQALWINALRIAARLDDRWRRPAARAHDSFGARFWNEARGCLHDVVDDGHVSGAVDDRVRPNQVLAVGGLPSALLVGERARSVVDAVERELWTPLGLRSLAPGDPGYNPRYEGGPAVRDAAYHNGTVWPWLLGPFVEAWVRVRGGTAAAKAEARRRFLAPLRLHLRHAGLGHVSEIADAEPPHTPRGCPFQAWSLGELLRLELCVLADGPRTRESKTLEEPVR
ncbi:MAG TPA: amylo-alpha-1,6-glucosidase [Planctomycetota bacterium]